MVSFTLPAALAPAARQSYGLVAELAQGSSDALKKSRTYSAIFPLVTSHYTDWAIYIH